MIDDLAIRAYLSPPDELLWQWSEDGEAVQWRNGVTIAFREEVAEVLAHLAPRGLPSFGALVILLAATRDGWGTRGGEESLLSSFTEIAGAVHGPREMIPSLLAGLGRVAALPAELRTSLPAKCFLADLALEESPRVEPPGHASVIVAAVRSGLREPLQPSHIIVRTVGHGPPLLVRDLALLEAGLQRVDEETLRLLLGTGLTALPKPAELDLPHSAVATQLISSLAGDEELAGVARVAKRLLSSASLPRRLSAAPEQELGGYSDIASRGSLDRLLTSELAHDNLTLAVRVAMNEALYLRRESPPSRPHQHRAVLIDSGIRAWGVPRVFATAAALAFAATTAREGAIRAWRAAGNNLAPVDLLTREGLVEHLRALEPERNAAAAIPEFLARAASDSAEPVELVLLMTEDGLDDPAVQEALRRADAPQLFLATVNRDGRFRMYERRLHGSKLIREATLELGDIGGDVSSLVDQSQRSRRTDLPAIFSVEPFPLLFPHVVHSTRSWHAGRWGNLALTSDRRLLSWTGREHGARQIADKLPVGKVWWVGLPDAEDNVTLVVGTSSKLHLVRTDRAGRHVEALPLREVEHEAAMVAATHGVLLVSGRHTVSVVNMTTGRVMETLKVAWSMTPHRDRFFSDPGGRWFALAHDGRAVRFEPIEPKGGESKRPRLVGMFDQSGADGPIGVTDLGFSYSTAKGTVRRLQHELKGAIRLGWASPDGCRIALEGSNPPRRVLADTQILTISYCPMDAVDDRVVRSSRPVTLRQRFVAVGVTPSGNLALRSHRGQVLSFRPHQGLPVFVSAVDGVELRHERQFQPRSSEFGYTLRTARWNDGSECWLDSRGLLHLRAAARSVPETTLVLCEGEFSGWSADGKLWGREYFVGRDERVVHTAGAQLAAFEATVARFVAGING